VNANYRLAALAALGERPNEARMHTDVNEASAGTQHPSGLAERRLPVVRVRMDERGHHGGRAMGTNWKSSNVACNDRQPLADVT